jgi:hypothetical protein
LASDYQVYYREDEFGSIKKNLDDVNKTAKLIRDCMEDILKQEQSRIN